MKTETKQALTEYYNKWQRYNEQLKHLEKAFSFDSATESLIIVKQMKLLEDEFLKHHKTGLYDLVLERSGADNLSCFILEDRVYYGPSKDSNTAAYFSIASLIED